MIYRSKGNSLKAYINIIKHRIPSHIKLIAELRMVWEEIVGEGMAKRSQPVKCEYIPKKNTEGKSTGEFSKRVVVNVKDDITKTAMTSYASEYLEKIPQRFKIHSLRFQQMSKDLISVESHRKAQLPVYNVSEGEKTQLLKRVKELSFSEDLEKIMLDYLIVWKHQRNNNQSPSSIK